MSLSDLQQSTLHEFLGPMLRTDPTVVNAGRALLSLNAEYNLGSVGTRKGFALVNAINEPMATLYNWIFNNTGVNANYLIWYNPSNGNVRLRSFDPNVIADLVLYNVASGAGASIAAGSTFLFSCVYDASGNGLAQARVTSQYVAGINTDIAFQGPLTALPTLSNTGTGSITAGTKRIGYILQTRNGFTGSISPVISLGKFNTASQITAPGGKQITFSLTATWPADAAVVYPVMTTSNNLDRYFIVPGLSAGVTAGLPFPVNFTIDISDADLASTGTDVTNNLLLLTQDTSGNGPFKPSCVGVCGSRTIYITSLNAIPQAYASDPDNPQLITADQHVLYLPGFRQMVTQFVLNGVLYILGPHWTYAFQDTGDVPVTWPSAQLVDGSIGTLSIHGVTANASTGLAWVADVTGLYLFSGGAYQTPPASYMVEPDWKRINWAAAQSVNVVDNKDRLQVYVVAPMNFNGYVTTNGTAVTLVEEPPAPAKPTGQFFGLGWTNGTAITINGVNYTVASVQGPNALTLTGSAGVQSTPVAASVTPTYPTHILAFDYAQGYDSESIKYSLWDLLGYAPGGAAVVMNPTTKLLELWMGCSAGSANGTPILRQMGVNDAAPYNDNSQAINFEYETSLLPGLNERVGTIFHFYAEQARVTGVGNLACTIYGLDRTKSVSWNPVLSLSAAPGQTYTKRHARLRSESASYRFSMFAANQNAILAALDAYYGIGPSFR